MKKPKKYRIIQENGNYFLQKQYKLLWLLPVWEYVTTRNSKGSRSRVFSPDEPKLLKRWLAEVEAGRINPENTDLIVIEEFEA